MTLLDLKRELHRKSFYHFIVDYWHTVEPVKYIESNLTRYLADLFQFIIRNKLPDDVKEHWMSDKEYAKVVKSVKNHNKIDVRTNPKQHWNINMPPRHSKSLILNVFASVWLYAVVEEDMAVKVAGLSHTSKLASEMNTKKQQIINSEQFREEYPYITTLVNQSDKIVGSNLAEIYTVSMDKMTGRGLNYAILDDLVTAQTAVKQQEELRNALRFMQNTLPSRLNKVEEDVIINIAQRLGAGDISDYIITELGDLYQTVRLQAIAEEDIDIIFPCSGEVWSIKKGESLLPERFSVEAYERIRTQMGDTYFEAQYLQNAISTKDTLIKPNMIQYMNEYEAEDILNNFDQVYGSHDLPVNEKETSDMHGAVIALKRGAKLLFIDAYEGHLGFLGSQAFIKNLASNEDYKGIIQLIENKANGAVVIQTLQRNVPGIITVEPGSRSKRERLAAASDWLVAGNVYFLTNVVNQPSERIKMLIQRITHFPFVKHDDVVDAFSQMVNYVFTQREFGLFEQSLSDDNYITPNFLDSWVKSTYVAVVREGFEYAMLKVGYDGSNDTFYVLEEDVFRADDLTAIERIKDFAKGSRGVIDATKDNLLYNMFISKLRIMNNPDTRNVSEQVAQLNFGLTLNKIQYKRELVEFRGDLDRIAWDQNALANGVERLKNKERLVACLRTVVYFIKGGSEFY